MPSFANVLRLFICLLVCYGTAAIGGRITSANLAWYGQLARPALTPPDWVFGVVWTLLYGLMALAAFLAWRRVIPPAKVRLALGVFAFQLILNVLWVVVFFGTHSLPGGLILVIFLWFSICLNVLVFWPVSRVAALLLLPYLGWVGFAAYLNAALVPLNM